MVMLFSFHWLYFFEIGVRLLFACGLSLGTERRPGCFFPAFGDRAAHLVSLFGHHHIQAAVGAFFVVDVDGFGDGHLR